MSRKVYAFLIKKQLKKSTRAFSSKLWPKLGKNEQLNIKLESINGIEKDDKGRNISLKSSYFRLYYAKHTT